MNNTSRVKCDQQVPAVRARAAPVGMPTAPSGDVVLVAVLVQKPSGAGRVVQAGRPGAVVISFVRVARVVLRHWDALPRSGRPANGARPSTVRVTAGLSVLAAGAQQSQRPCQLRKRWATT